MTKTPEELTEDWKAGKLDSGWYFVKVEGFREVDVDLYDKESNSWLCNSDKDLNPLNVITPVPSYNENKAMQAKLAELEEENNKLRGLLKDTKLFYEECNPHDFTVVADNMDFYLPRINAALGESEE